MQWAINYYFYRIGPLVDGRIYQARRGAHVHYWAAAVQWLWAISLKVEHFNNI